MAVWMCVAGMGGGQGVCVAGRGGGVPSMDLVKRRSVCKACEQQPPHYAR